MTGEPTTALQRLKASWHGSPAFDLALVRGRLLGGDSLAQLRQLAPCLAPGGMIVFACEDEDTFMSAWPQIQQEFDGLGYVECDNAPTGLILSGMLQGAHVLRVDLTKPPPRPWPTQLRRACDTLARLHMYPDYARRVWRRARHMLSSKRR